MKASQRLLLSATAIAVALSACGPRHGAAAGAAAAGAPPIAVDTATSQRQDIATSVSLDGQIAPLMMSTLSTPQSGNVTAVYVNEGTRVTRGELLAKLDDATLRAQLAQLQAQRAGGAATLQSSTLQAPVTASQASSTVVTAQQALQAAQNNVQTSDAAYRSALATYTADKTLLTQGYVAQTQYETARAAYVQTQQALTTAKQQAQQAKIALIAARSAGGQASPIQTQVIAGNRASVAALDAQIRATQTAISQTNIIAPFDGVVTARLLDPGAFASPNVPVVTVSQVDPVYVNVNVPDDDLGWVRSGTPVTFTTSGANRTYAARVMDVNATPTTGTLSYRARLRVPNPGNELRGGMLVTVAVRKEFHQGVVVVPLTAVQQADTGSSVIVVTDGADPKGPKSAKLVPVKVGITTDQLAEVHSADVPSGTTVVVMPPDQLIGALGQAARTHSPVAVMPAAPTRGAQ